MLTNLPTKIKKMIFGRVRLMDLYEVSGVSREWWAFTMATCSTICDAYSDFLKYQVTFCNKMMPKKEGWQVWMLIEFTDDKSIKLFGFPDTKIIEYFKRQHIRVLKLIYRGHPSILPVLKEIFPHLQTLDFTPDFHKYDDKTVELPYWLKNLRLIINPVYPRSDLMDVFRHLEFVKSLHIRRGLRILFDNICFDKLKYLRLHMSDQLTDDIKSLVTKSKKLSIVYLEDGLIEKEWLGLFPTSIQKIRLRGMRLNKAIVPLFGTAEAFVERQLMRFVSQDWTKISLFKSSSWSDDNNYNHNYVCKPQLLEEELEITIKEGKTPCGLLDSGKLQLKVLKLIEGRDTKYDLDIIVPKSVQHFEWKANQFGAIDFAPMFEDISTIKTLLIKSSYDKNVQFGKFPHACSLIFLDIPSVNNIILESILRNCQSLKQLSLMCPRENAFRKLTSDLKFPSLKELFIFEPKDSFTNILGHFPNLVDLHFQYLYLETVTIADLAKLTSVEFVRISFVDANDLVALNLVVKCLDALPFSHLIIGYRETHSSLFCVMGNEKAFFRRYFSSDIKNDITHMNIQGPFGFMIARPMYLKGVSSTHLNALSKSKEITHDLHEFIANTLPKAKQK